MSAAQSSEISKPASPALRLARKDFDAGQDVRWCPGCGDYSILANMQRFLPSLGVAPEKHVFVSGIGCSSRFPYYMNTYGFHTIHGRAPTIATGLKLARPDLHVWVVTGDGDALSIGGNHLLHVLRRNIDLTILLFNNRIYGLTKGQYSPTSEVGKVTKSTPQGSLDRPLVPLRVALGAGATFLARTIDTDAKGTQEVLRASHAHKGTALVEILQNCNVFNDGAFTHLTGRDNKAYTQLHLVADKPMLYGKDGSHGIGRRDGALVWGCIGQDLSEDEVLVHRPQDADASVAFALCGLTEETAPVPLGVLRSVDAPSYDTLFTEAASEKSTTDTADKAALDALLQGSESYVVG